LRDLSTADLRTSDKDQVTFYQKDWWKPEQQSVLWAAFNSFLCGSVVGMKLTPHHRLGQNVCRLRTQKALTQEQLAEKADLSRRYLQRIESGERNPTVDVLAKLRRALACSWNDLFEDIL